MSSEETSIELGDQNNLGSPSVSPFYKKRIFAAMVLGVLVCVTLLGFGARSLIPTTGQNRQNQNAPPTGQRAASASSSSENEHFSPLKIERKCVPFSEHAEDERILPQRLLPERFKPKYDIFPSVIRFIYHALRNVTGRNEITSEHNGFKVFWDNSMTDGFNYEEFGKLKPNYGISRFTNWAEFGMRELGLSPDLFYITSQTDSLEAESAFFESTGDSVKPVGAGELTTSEGVSYRAIAIAVPKNRHLLGGAHRVYLRDKNEMLWTMFDDEERIIGLGIAHDEVSELEAVAILYLKSS
jgi:hypothetical protein